MVFLSTNRPACIRAVLGAILAGSVGWATPVSAGDDSAPAEAPLEPIAVTATKPAEAVADEELTKQVKTALHDDLFFYDAHITITVKDGVVTLEGLVFDFDDVRDAYRIIRENVTGVRRVVNELEICGCDGGA